MSLASLVDKPLMQNPLAGGGAPQIIDPSVITPRGGAPTTLKQADPNNLIAGYTPPTGGTFNDMPLEGGLPPLLDNLPITAPGQIPERYKEGFEEFYKQNPDDFMRIGGQAISYVTTPQGETIQFGDTGGATNFRRYLESIGETPRNNVLSLVQESGPLQPTRPEQNPNAIRVPADPIQTGGLGDQGLMDRLTSLEQGIGSLQNQIANLFQMGQASDPFGLGSFINTRRY